MPNDDKPEVKKDKPHSDNQVKFFNQKGFIPKGGIRTSSPSNSGMSLSGGGKGTRPAQ